MFSHRLILVIEGFGTLEMHFLFSPSCRKDERKHFAAEMCCSVCSPACVSNVLFAAKVDRGVCTQRDLYPHLAWC